LGNKKECKKHGGPVYTFYKNNLLFKKEVSILNYRKKGDFAEILKFD
jgi:hypothetical protein